jgi:transposase InsO family protein
VNTHKNARLTYARRVELARRAARPRANQSALAREFGVSRQTVRKWCARYRAEGERGLRDRSSRPRRSPRQLPRHRRHQIRRGRQRRWSSVRIAQHYGLPVSTVVHVQRRLGLHRLARLEPPRPVVRYEHAEPGALVHLDIKQLARIGRVGHRIHGDPARRTRGLGWEHLHVAIDDCTRLAYAEVLARADGAAAAAFLARALHWFAALGVHVRRLLTDNGKCYTHSSAFQRAVAGAQLRHRTTRPYRPQTNGKAERLIRTLVHEWAYAQAYRHSAARTTALAHYLHFYNTERRHSALGFLTPAQRLAAKL